MSHTRSGRHLSKLREFQAPRISSTAENSMLRVRGTQWRCFGPHSKARTTKHNFFPSFFLLPRLSLTTSLWPALSHPFPTHQDAVYASWLLADSETQVAYKAWHSQSSSTHTELACVANHGAGRGSPRQRPEGPAVHIDYTHPATRWEGSESLEKKGVTRRLKKGGRKSEMVHTHTDRLLSEERLEVVMKTLSLSLSLSLFFFFFFFFYSSPSSSSSSSSWS